MPIVISNIAYGFLLLCSATVPLKERLRIYLYPRTRLRFSTMTCWACKCYHEHPAGIQLTRLAILVISFLMRFISFILGSVCATKFNPICVPYAVLSSLFLIPSLITLLIEMFHFHIFWNYESSHVTPQRSKRATGFLRFFPFKMTYDERRKEYGVTTDAIGCQCDSVSLAHSILYHSATISPRIPLPPLIDGKVIIAYHLTSKENAMKIVENGFPLAEKKELSDEISFSLHIPPASAARAIDEEAIICVRLSLDHVLQVNDEGHFKFDKHRFQTPEPRGLELMPDRKIKVKYPRQIEKWIVLFRSDTGDTIQPAGYQGLL